MSCGPLAPIFWQRQPRLPMPVFKFLRARLEAALADPADRAFLVWPMVLGAPKLVAAHPEGVPEALLLEQAAGILRSVGVTDPKAAWDDALIRCPDTADRAPEGFLPQRAWAPLGALVSLRLGVTLLALQGQPEDERYRLGAGVALFNCALFHECHDAFESLWIEAEGPLKAGLQGLIMLAGGFHHQQMHNARGMMNLLEDARRLLPPDGGVLRTPWGDVDPSVGSAAAAERLAWLADYDGEMDLAPLWAMPRPTLELT